MKKKAYSTPLMDIVVLKQQQPLLTSSYDGYANAPEFDLGNDDVTFSDDISVDFN